MFRDVTVLIAEDDPAELTLFRRWTEGAKFTARTVREVYEGIRELDNGVDILVLDINLLNGKADALLERWMERAKGPVLVVSGDIDHEERSRYFCAGAWSVLSKPIGPAEFVHILHNFGTVVLDRKKSERLEVKVGKLDRAVVILALFTAALGGVELLPKIVSFLGAMF